ncbi:MAG: hypothetical protein FK733_09055 [Asgard group archaeon]|nr:hypothetical protein [Asgard group archaeon]
MRVGKAAAKAIIECVKAVGDLSSNKSIKITTEKLLSHLKMSFEYVSDAIEGAFVLQFVKKEEVLSLTVIGKKIANSTTHEAKDIFRTQMKKLPFIVQLKKFIHKENDFENSVRKIIKEFDIKGEEKDIIYSFKNWMRFANL